jgi:hypothetical protein
MPNKITEFFLKKNPYFTNDEVVGYFDFTFSGNSGSNTVQSADWCPSTVNIEIINTNKFWQYSGLGYFSTDSCGVIKNLNSNNFMCIFGYDLNDISNNNIFLSSAGENNNIYSGINFGINGAGWPYVEYYDELLGPVSLCHNEKASKTGIFYLEIAPTYTAVGIYNQKINRISKSYLEYNNAEQIYSNNFKLGSGIDFDKSPVIFNGKISEIIICDGAVFNKEFIEKSFISGLSIELVDQVTTGIISGQTGIINGDIIELNKCLISTQSSGVYVNTYESGQFFATFQDFLDFNNELYYEFSQQSSFITGSGFVNTGIALYTCETITGMNFYEFESGYIFEYKITNKIPNHVNFKYLNSNINSIYLRNKIDKHDTLFILGDKNPNELIGNNNYILEKDSSNIYFNFINLQFDISGLYLNGQIQTYDKNYSIDVISGIKIYTPEKDYFTSGNLLYTNYNYNDLEASIISADLWSHQSYITTGGIASGTVLPSINTSKKLVFLNGQLLNSGVEYSGSKILFNIPSGYNVMSFIDISNKDYVQYKFTNTSGNLFEAPNISKQTSMVWLNGIRLQKEEDYIEMASNDLESFNNLFISNGNHLLISIYKGSNVN